MQELTGGPRDKPGGGYNFERLTRSDAAYIRALLGHGGIAGVDPPEIRWGLDVVMKDGTVKDYYELLEEENA